MYSKKHFCLYFAIILFSFIISSCNTSNKVVSSGFIQKRKYNKGYNIEWLANKGKPHPSIAKNEKLSAKEKVLIPYQTIIPKKDSSIISETVNPQKEDDRLIASVDNGAEISYQPKDNFIQSDTLIKHSLDTNNPDSSDSKEHIINPFSVIGLLFAVIGLICLFSSLTIIGSSALTILLLSIPCEILALIFCCIGLYQIQKEPKNYVGKWISILGIILACAYYLAIIIGFILLLVGLSELNGG